MGVAGDSSILSSLPAEEPVDAEPPERIIVTVVEEDGDWSGFASLEESILEAARALSRNRDMQAEGSEASVVLGSDALVRRLNRSYRGKDSPTNVLSFPFQPPPGAAGKTNAYLGDVVLAAETVRREAAGLGIEPRHHLQHLVVHGLLHLLGYDHDTDRAAETMEALETEILAAAGIADPYAVPASLDET